MGFIRMLKRRQFLCICLLFSEDWYVRLLESSEGAWYHKSTRIYRITLY